MIVILLIYLNSRRDRNATIHVFASPTNNYTTIAKAMKKISPSLTWVRFILRVDHDYLLASELLNVMIYRTRIWCSKFGLCLWSDQYAQKIETTKAEKKRETSIER